MVVYVKISIGCNKLALHRNLLKTVFFIDTLKQKENDGKKKQQPPSASVCVVQASDTERNRRDCQQDSADCGEEGNIYNPQES